MDTTTIRQRRRELLDRRTVLENERDDLVARQLDQAADDAGIAERVDRLTTGIERVKNEVAELAEVETDLIRAAVRNGSATLVPGSVVDPSHRDEDRGRVWDRAHRLVDDAVRRGLPSHAADAADRLLRSGGTRDRTTAARWVETTGTEDYLRAFGALLADPSRGHLMWSDRERDAFRQAEEFRAMSLTDAAGGYLVPFQLDPSIMLSSDGSIDPIRRIARTVQATGDVWNGVSSAGVTAEWLAEGAEAADAAPTIAQPSITVHKGSAFVPYSYEVGLDAVDLVGELGPLLTEAADNLQAAAHATGTGSGQPVGIVTALTGGSSVVASATTDTFAAADVYALIEAVPPRFRPRAEWIASLPTLNSIAQFETTNGARLFPSIDDGQLLMKPAHECSGLDGSITATEDNYIAVVGDFQNFVVADRIGTTVELIPNLMGANQRPTGQRGMFMWFRTGSDSVVDEAFRMLNVT